MRNPVFASHNALNWCLVRKHYHLRSTLVSGCNSELLSIQTDVTFGILTVTEGCRLRTITTKLLARNQKSERSKPSSTDLNCVVGNIKSSKKLNAYKPGLHESSGVQHHNLQQKLVDSRILEWPATVLVVDIETTGFSCKFGRIIEIAIRDLLGGRNSTFETLVKPKKEVLNSDIHGITSQMVNRSEVPSMEELIPILIQFVRSRQMAGKPVLWIAHNGRRFDIPFILKEFSRCSMEIPSDWFFVDTLPIARRLVKHDGSKLSSLSLEALREHYEIPLVGPSHRAMQDVMTLCLVLQKMSFELKLSVSELLESAFQASDITKI